MNAYTPLTRKDISRMMRMPAVCDQPFIDINTVLPTLLAQESFATCVAFVYKWGYLQGKKDIADWHGQTSFARNQWAKKEAATQAG